MLISVSNICMSAVTSGQLCENFEFQNCCLQGPAVYMPTWTCTTTIYTCTVMYTHTETSLHVCVEPAGPRTVLKWMKLKLLLIACL